MPIRQNLRGNGYFVDQFLLETNSNNCSFCGYTLFMLRRHLNRRGVEDDDNDNFRTPNFEIVLLQPRFSVDFLIKKTTVL